MIKEKQPIFSRATNRATHLLDTLLQYTTGECIHNYQEGIDIPIGQ